jgi:hypothetical protein
MSVGQAPLLGAAIAVTLVAVGFVSFVLRTTRDSDVPRWLVAVGATLFALPFAQC